MNGTAGSPDNVQAREPTPAELLASVEKLIEKRVREMAPHLQPHERDDARQAARQEVWIAAHRYCSSYGARFTTFSVPYMTGGIAKYLRGEAKQSRLKEQLRRSAADYLAEEPSDFNVVYDDDSTLRARLQTAADRQIGAMVLALSQAPDGPEEALSERRDRTAAARIILRAMAQATPQQQAIVRGRYCEGREMKDIAAETGTPGRTLRSHHEKLLDALREQMTKAGIGGPPEEEAEE